MLRHLTNFSTFGFVMRKREGEIVIFYATTREEIRNNPEPVKL